MKNIGLSLMACAMLLVFGACGNGQNQNEKEQKAQLVEQPVVTTSPDLAFFDLRGPVKSCDGVEFNRSGKITSGWGYDLFAVTEPQREYDEATGTFAEYCKWERKGDYISSITCYETYDEYTWEDGRIAIDKAYVEGMVFKMVYAYDADGFLEKVTTYNGEEDAETDENLTLDSTTEYYYTDIDDHGNWTRRKVKDTDALSGYVNETEETRTIEYY